MTTKSLELEIQLKTEKEQLRTSLARLSERANDALDWRQQFRRHPVPMFGAAMAAGLVLGAVTRSARANPSSDPRGRGPRGARGQTPSVAWDRVKVGVSGMIADRAILAARDLLDGFLDGASGARRFQPRDEHQRALDEERASGR